MFEDALFESNGRIRTHRGRFSGVAAIVQLCRRVHSAVVAPDASRIFAEACTQHSAGGAPTPCSAVVHVTRPASVATRPAASLNLTAPRVIPDRISAVEDEPSSADLGLISFGRGIVGSPNGLPDSINAAPPPQVRVVPPRKAGDLVWRDGRQEIERRSILGIQQSRSQVMCRARSCSRQRSRKPAQSKTCGS